ncbi:MAG: DUF374 domain-containing protein [Candidatus Krumholzibacteriia bacterium]
MGAAKSLVAPPAWLMFTATVRCNTTDLPPRPAAGPVIFACLHRDILPALLHVRPAHPFLLVSRSPDGDLLVRALARHGFRFVRGAGGEAGGAAAFRGLLQALAGGNHVGVAVDGPRGPFGRIRTGVLELARRSGRPVLPLTARAGQALVLRSWDRTVVPWPFSRVEVLPLARVTVADGAGRAGLERARDELRARLLGLEAGREDGDGDP